MHGALEIIDAPAVDASGAQYRARILEATSLLVVDPIHEEAGALEAMNDVPRLEAMLKDVRQPGRIKVNWRRVLATRALEYPVALALGAGPIKRRTECQ